MIATPLRLVTWNCRQRVDAKRHAFERLGAHVLVLPECTARPKLAGELGVSFLWRGEYAAKGLAVVGFDGWKVEPLEAPIDLPWILPARVRDPEGRAAFDLLAVWTVARRDGRVSYSEQVAGLLDVWAPALAAGNTVVAGDFNCSLQSTTQTSAHRRNLERFAELGLRSGYHTYTTDGLLPRVTGVTVGGIEEWIDSGLSDHCPVAVDFAHTSN